MHVVDVLSILLCTFSLRYSFMFVMIMSLLCLLMCRAL